MERQGSPLFHPDQDLHELVLPRQYVVCMIVPPLVRSKAKKSQVRACFKWRGKGYIASQCPSQKVNTMLHGDSTTDEEPLDEGIEVKTRRMRGHGLER